MRRDLPMRGAVGPLFALLLLVSCGQPYSNEDLAFLAALPEREQLETHVPEDVGTTGSGLTASHSALGVGDVSQLYRDTSKAGNDFNSFLEAILGLLDNIRQVPATTREEQRRIWGPYPWEGQRTFEVRVVIDRIADGEFTWDIQFRNRVAVDAPWGTFVHGTASTDAQFRSGKGTVSIPVAEVAATGVALAGLEVFERMDIAYDAMNDPVEVELNALVVTGEEIAFASRRFVDGSGKFVFDVRRDWVPGSFPQDRARVTTRWLADHRGRADVEILEGDGAGAHALECWGTDFRVTYLGQNWVFGVVDGDPASCIARE
ncbi:MAG: hypothetical protein L0Y66_27190 [Myxococcaceae bacterium]|nr:hypothetical protein [Myxococcaceae bacterium]MCI0673472.1 hypothetical protein [Myxococcaceae bacterium]